MLRSQRLRPVWPFTIGLALIAGCEGHQQGYYGPCDEPAGGALDCPREPTGPLTPWDGCMKLSTCGVLLPQEDPSDPAPDQAPAFDRCVEQLARAEQDLGDVVLECIENATCADLTETIDEDDDPNAQNRNIEGVVGWCGRLDPR